MGRKLELTCPIQLCRIKTAAVGKRCRHVQCFDLEAYISTTRNQSNFERRWECPICTERILPTDISFDVLAQTILDDKAWTRDGRQPSSDDSVLFQSDGTWSVLTSSAAQSSNAPDMATDIDANADDILSISDGDEPSAASSRPVPAEAKTMLGPGPFPPPAEVETMKEGSMEKRAKKDKKEKKDKKDKKGKKSKRTHDARSEGNQRKKKQDDAVGSNNPGERSETARVEKTKQYGAVGSKNPGEKAEAATAKKTKQKKSDAVGSNSPVEKAEAARVKEAKQKKSEEKKDRTVNRDQKSNAQEDTQHTPRQADKRRKTEGSLERGTGPEVDVPPDHVAHTKVKIQGRNGSCPRACFVHNGDVKGTHIQVTAKQAGSLEEAARICRLCYWYIDNGFSKEEVLVFRAQQCQAPREGEKEPQTAAEAAGAWLRERREQKSSEAAG